MDMKDFPKEVTCVRNLKDGLNLFTGKEDKKTF